MFSYVRRLALQYGFKRQGNFYYKELEGFAVGCYGNGSQIMLTFLNAKHTPERLSGVLNWLLPRMKQLNIQGTVLCGGCGQRLEPEEGALIRVNSMVYKMHGECCKVAVHQARQEAEEYKKTNKHIGRGTLGAILFGLIGMVPWIVVYCFGWIVGWLGFLIGLAARKGYELFGGRICKAKFWIILSVTVVCVFLATFAAYSISLYIEITSAGLQYFCFRVPGLVWQLIGADPEAAFSFAGDLVMGILFAMLGIRGLLRQTFREADAVTALAEVLS